MKSVKLQVGARRLENSLWYVIMSRAESRVMNLITNQVRARIRVMDQIWEHLDEVG